MNSKPNLSFRNGEWLALVVFTSFSITASAGYEAPCFIDGCQSISGRFIITAKLLKKARTVHGPHEWQFVWLDQKTKEKRTYPANGVQGGQVYAHLFLAPDGKTFALWNHVTLWSKSKSRMHGPKDMRPILQSPEYRNREEFSHRLIIYNSKDGSILKKCSIIDLIREEEWESIGPFFNRMHWLKEYPDKSGRLLKYKQTLRTGYAFYRISPDYTLLEFQVPTPRSKRKRNSPPGRIVRVSLTDGRLLPEGKKLLDKNKIPVRPWVGPDYFPGKEKEWREGYVPSLDPVRVAGRFTRKPGKETKNQGLQLIKDGFDRLDVPSWSPKEKQLIFTDLKSGTLYQLVSKSKIAKLKGNVGRVRIGPDGRYYGLMDGILGSWYPNERSQVIIETANGRPISLNDLAVSTKSFLYFSTLKDPEKGRLSVVDLKQKRLKVMWDGNNEPTLWNPNGVALSPDEKYLYVGISSYKKRSNSCVYRFPILADGSLNVAAGKKSKWAAIRAPDGIATDSSGDVYITAGNKIHVLSPDGKKKGSLRVPKGSATNLCFGGENGQTLFVTTWNALYAVEMIKDRK